MTTILLPKDDSMYALFQPGLNNCSALIMPVVSLCHIPLHLFHLKPPTLHRQNTDAAYTHNSCTGNFL